MKKIAKKADSYSIKTKEIDGVFHLKMKLLVRKFLEDNSSSDSGLKFQNSYSDLIDKTINNFTECFNSNEKLGDFPVLIALGGYGRKELSPYSDIDLVFIYADALSRPAKKFIESLNSALWSAGLKLSASVRSLDDCEKAMKEDLSFLTSLLEKRHVWGPKATYQKLEKVYQQHIKATPPGFFTSSKLAERDLRHHKMGDSRYQLEPNVKEGKGALRDIHTLLWITNFLYGAKQPEELARKKILTGSEAATLKRALHFFWKVRCHLHLQAGRAHDRLSFDMQPVIAQLMGYKDQEPHVRAEKFMKDYFLMAREVGHLTRVLCAKIEEQSLSQGATAGTKKLVLEEAVDGFKVKGNRLTVKNASVFKDNPSEIIRIFHVSQTSGIDIHPETLRYVRDALPKLKKANKESYALFLKILLEPLRAEQTLRRMNEADVLGALIPDFNNIIAHMQYDMYHSFTADEHTIHAVGLLHQIENGHLGAAAPLATSLFTQIRSRRALYVAMFLHDIAKGTGGNHSEAGARIARKLCPLMGLTAEETETVAWLVQEHLLMTLTAFKRDLNDPKTIEDFVSAVQSPERLKLLTILTTADIMAVGPERWNNWKSGLLLELYHQSLAAMSDVKTPLSHLLPSKELYEKGKTLIKITPHPAQDHTEVVVTTPDRKGLFATLSGAMAASGASIVAARIYTLNNGLAQDVFYIQDLKGHVYENSSFLQKTIKAALDDKINLTAEIRDRQKNAPKKASLFKVIPRVIIDNNASNSNTVIEVNGADRPGLLYAVTSQLSKQGLQISAAKITTFGSRAVDVFYVRDNFGLKILHAGKLNTIENSLKQALEKGL